MSSTSKDNLDEPRHVDDFIDDPKSDPYAASWFESFRRPAFEKCTTPDSRKLFATYEGTRYRVTGCSRFGDVWLHSRPTEDTTYEHRVNVDECSAWAPTFEVTTDDLDDSIGELADGLTNTTSQILLGEARSSLTRLRRYALTESDKMDVDYLSLALEHLEEHMGTRTPKDYEPAAIDYLERLGVDPAMGLKPLMRLIADVACSVGVKK